MHPDLTEQSKKLIAWLKNFIPTIQYIIGSFSLCVVVELPDI